MSAWSHLISAWGTRSETFYASSFPIVSELCGGTLLPYLIVRKRQGAAKAARTWDKLEKNRRRILGIEFPGFPRCLSFSMQNASGT